MGAEDGSTSGKVSEEKDLLGTDVFGPRSKNTVTGKWGWQELSARASCIQAVVHCSIIRLGLFQVSRNFELVGRVNLDQLEQMKEKMESSSSDDEDKEEEMNSKADDRG